MFGERKITEVECPLCGEVVQIACLETIPYGTIAEKECAEGHKFRVRFLEGQCEVVSPDDSSGSREET